MEEAKQKTPISGFRLALLIVSGALAMFSLAYFIYICASGNDPYNKFMTTLLETLMFLVPIAAHLIFKNKITDFTIAFYVIFLFVASFLGQVLRFNTHFPWYDKFAHFTFGYVGCVIGLFVVCKLADYDSLRPVFVAIFVFCVSMMCAAVWEIMEFISSRFLGQTAQGAPQLTESGKYVVDITDTMLDIISNLGGAVLFLAHYIAHKVSKKSLLMGAIVKDFNQKPEPETAKETAEQA